MRVVAATALAGLVAALAVGGAARAAGAGGEIYAVVVGYNGGQGVLPELRYADDDAARFALLLRGLDTPERRVHVWMLASIDAESDEALARAGISVRPEGPPTRAALDAALASVARGLAARRPGAPAPVLYFMYAGHGLGRRILLEPEGGAQAAITGHEIRAAIAGLTRVAPDLRAFVFLDACRSQSLFAERGPDAEVGPDLSPQAQSLERSAETVHMGVLTAAASGRPAGEVGALASGYFSHVLASGLTGAADANGDQLVSFAELVAFVAFNTERLTGQRPWFTPPGGDLGEAAIDLRGLRTGLELSTAAPGRYLVEAVSGRPIFAEAYKGNERRLRLVLPAGRYRLVHVAESGRTRRGEIELRAGEAIDVAGVALGDDGAGSAVSTRGDDTDAVPVFSGPFSPEVVATLAAGYDAGRAPAESWRDSADLLAVAAVLSAPPLSVGGTEPGLGLSYRHVFGRLFGGVRLGFGRSSHTAAGGYQLDRYTAMLEGGPVWSFAERLEGSLSIAAGGVAVVRRADGAPLRGDPFAPALSAGGALGVRLGADVSVGLGTRYLVQWVRLDGARKASGTPEIELGLSYRF